MGWTTSGQRRPLGKARATGAGGEGSGICTPLPCHRRGGTSEEQPGQLGHGGAQLQRESRLGAGTVILVVVIIIIMSIVPVALPWNNEQVYEHLM